MAHGHAEQNDDARQQPRADALRGALIQDASGNPGLRCLITNISSEGAELELTSNVRVPPAFMLQIPHEGLTYRAQVRWRQNGRIGVEFFGAEKTANQALRAVS